MGEKTGRVEAMLKNTGKMLYSIGFSLSLFHSEQSPTCSFRSLPNINYLHTSFALSLCILGYSRLIQGSNETIVVNML